MKSSYCRPISSIFGNILCLQSFLQLVTQGNRHGWHELTFTVMTSRLKVPTTPEILHFPVRPLKLSLKTRNRKPFEERSLLLGVLFRAPSYCCALLYLWVCVCVCVYTEYQNRNSTCKVRIFGKWGHLGWSAQLQRTVYGLRFGFKVEARKGLD